MIEVLQYAIVILGSYALQCALVSRYKAIDRETAEHDANIDAVIAKYYEGKQDIHETLSELKVLVR